MRHTLAAALAASILLGFEGPALAHPTALSLQSASESLQTSRAGIIFDSRLPAAPWSLPEYRLVASAAPSAFVSESLARSGDAPLGMRGTHAVATAAHGTTRAYANFATGDAELYPEIARMHGAAPALATRVAAAAFSRPDVIARDATTFRLSAPSQLMMAAGNKPGRSTHAAAAIPARVALTYVSARRFAAGLPVYGTGSGATIGVADDGRVHAFVHRWKAAVPDGFVIATSDAAGVKMAIVRALSSFSTAGTEIEVRNVRLAYYDGQARYLQPVYQYRAVAHEFQNGRKLDQPVVGYVPFGRLREPLPTLTGAGGAQPAHRNATPSVVKTRPLDGSGRWTLNEYVIANSSSAFVAESNAFYDGLDSFSDNFNRVQYYWAQDAFYYGASPWFANSANILYTAAIGNVDNFLTNVNPSDTVYVNQIGIPPLGTRGFGAATGGSLCHWVIASGDTLGSMYDFSIITGNPQDAFNTWWALFQGLHDTLGFRTLSWLNDGNDGPFGESAAFGGDIAATWFDAIESDGVYDDETYYESNIHQYVHYGRASAMVDARFLGHSIYDVTPSGPSTQLYNYWLNN